MRLDEFLRNEQTRRVGTLAADLERLLHEVRSGQRPATVDLHNLVRALLGIPQESEPQYVEIPTGATWSGMLAELQAQVSPARPGVPIDIAPEVRTLRPAVTPGVYAIFVESDRERAGIPLSAIEDRFRALGTEGLYAPYIAWCIARGRCEGMLAPHLLEDAGAPPGLRMVGCDYHEKSLRFTPGCLSGGLAGDGFFVGAKKVA
jgi:hypothetical protein